MSLSTASEHAGNPAPDKPRTVAPQVFYEGTEVAHPEAVQGMVVAGRGGQPNDHDWCPKGEEFGPWSSRKANARKPAFFTMAAYVPDAVSRFQGRSAGNVHVLRGLWADIEGCPEKYQRKPDGGYADDRAAMTAVTGFCKATGLTPNFLVLTGNGGIHLHYVLRECVDRATWQPRAASLAKLCAQYQFKIDAQCTTDAARIMRAPGSLHQKTGKLVQAVAWRVAPYDLAEFDALVHFTPEVIEASAPAAQWGPALTAGAGVNAEIIDSYPRFSYKQAAARCGAMSRAAENNGQGVPYPVWVLAIKTAQLSVEGRAYAHEISRGHENYDPTETDKKIDSLTGGPASCEAWANAWGNAGLCVKCEFNHAED